MLTRLNAIAEVGSTAAAATSLVMAQTGIEPFLPLIITIVNGLFLLLQGRKALKRTRRRDDLPTPGKPPIAQPLPHATSAIDASDYAPK